jgi:predicted CoA-binding protein
MCEWDMATLLRHAKTIAVVGLSENPMRPSYGVAKYMQQHGFRIIPINPRAAGKHILNELCYASLQDAVLATGLRIDLVDCFRKAEDIPEIVDQAIAVKAGTLWMQSGISNKEAAQRAEHAGMQVVMDKCLKIEHARL